MVPAVLLVVAVAVANKIKVVSITSPRKLQLQREFASCRGIYSGVNSGLVDLGVLAAEGLYDSTVDDVQLARLLDQDPSVAGE